MPAGRSQTRRTGSSDLDRQSSHYAPSSSARSGHHRLQPNLQTAASLDAPSARSSQRTEHTRHSVVPGARAPATSSQVPAAAPAPVHAYWTPRAQRMPAWLAVRLARTSQVLANQGGPGPTAACLLVNVLHGAQLMQGQHRVSTAACPGAGAIVGGSHRKPPAHGSQLAHLQPRAQRRLAQRLWALTQRARACQHQRARGCPGAPCSDAAWRPGTLGWARLPALPCGPYSRLRTGRPAACAPVSPARLPCAWLCPPAGSCVPGCISLVSGVCRSLAQRRCSPARGM